MRTFIGMILGCLLTIGVVYFTIPWRRPQLPMTSASTSRAIVNWDVAKSEWVEVKENVRTTWLKLKANVS